MSNNMILHIAGLEMNFKNVCMESLCMRSSGILITSEVESSQI